MGNVWGECKDLALRAQEGDEKAYSRLFSLMKPSVIWYATVHFGSDRAEDIYQDVCLKVHKNFHSYNPEYAFSTWVIRITKNHGIDLGRNKRHSMNRDAYSLDDRISEDRTETWGDRLTSDTFVHPDDSFDQSLIHKYSEGFKEKLLDEASTYFDAFWLREVGGLSYNEISERLNKPLGTVKAHIFRGREKFIEYVHALDPEIQELFTT